MSEYVLDASAILAFLNQEVGAEQVAETLTDAVISAVNLSEVMTKLIERSYDEAN
jgi:ribonuclease VapC